MNVVVMVGVVVGREELAEEPERTQAAAEPVEQGPIFCAALTALEVFAHREYFAVDFDFVNVDRKSVGMQAEPTLLAGSINVRARKARSSHAERREFGRHVRQREAHAAVDHHRAADGPKLDSADRTPHQNRRVHAALGAELLEAHALLSQTRQALFTTGDQRIRRQRPPMRRRDRARLGELDRLLAGLHPSVFADRAGRPVVAGRRHPRAQLGRWGARGRCFARTREARERNQRCQQKARTKHRSRNRAAPAFESSSLWRAFGRGPGPRPLRKRSYCPAAKLEGAQCPPPGPVIWHDAGVGSWQAIFGHGSIGQAFFSCAKTIL